MSHRIKRFAAFAIFASFYLFVAVDSKVDTKTTIATTGLSLSDGSVFGVQVTLLPEEKITSQSPFLRWLTGSEDVPGTIRLTCSLRCLLAVINGSSRQPDSKPLHPELERRTLDSQTNCRSVGTCNDSVRFFQGTQNLIPFRFFQHFVKALRGS